MLPWCTCCWRSCRPTTRGRRSCRRSTEREVEGRPEDAALRDDGTDERGRRDVEGRIVHGRGLGRGRLEPDPSHLAGVALLDGDLASRRKRGIDRRGGRGHVEGHRVVTG